MEFPKRSKRRRAVVVVCALVEMLTVLGAVYLPVHGEEQIYDAVVRLHVVANSDSEQDQALKLRVRDAVLTLASERLVGCRDRDEAVGRLEGMLGELEAEAARVIGEAGYAYSVRVVLGEEDYPTRNYEAFCFPAGRYVSLRVMIGQAEGENFWCVLFPPLCMSAATVGRERAEEEFLAVGLSREQYAVITETEDTKYKMRFKFLEVFGRMLATD